MKYNLITTTATHTPIISHRILSDGGVCFHNSPSYHNVCGGNVIAEPISEILEAGRKIKRIDTFSKKDDLLDYAYRHKSDKFDYLKNNCEHFAFGFESERKSPQMKAIGILTLCSLVFLFR